MVYQVKDDDVMSGKSSASSDKCYGLGRLALMWRIMVVSDSFGESPVFAFANLKDVYYIAII